MTPQKRPDPGNRDEKLRRAESHVSPSQHYLRPEHGVRAALVGQDHPCRPSVPRPLGGRCPPSRPWVRVVLVVQDHPSHPSVRADRSGRSRPYRLWAREIPGVQVGPSHPWRLVGLAGRAHPSHLWAPAAPGGPERPLILLGLLAQAGAADRPTAWPACSLGLRAHPGAPTARACGERLVWRHALSWLGLSVLVVWPFSCLGFVPWQPPR